MPIDNEWYHHLGDAWWDTNGIVGPLHEVNPARTGYFCDVLGRLEGRSILEIGSGGGLMAEEYARRGADVAGVDRSLPSLRVARRHAAAGGIAIEYAGSLGEYLPFRDGTFDAVVTADTLEHVDDVERVIGEAARVLKAEGCFVYDTVNRTWKSRLLLIWLPQNIFHLAPPNTHAYDKFIRPEELHALLGRHGLTNCETRGLALRRNPVAAGFSYARTRRFGGFVIGEDTRMSYVGYARKTAAAAA